MGTSFLENDLYPPHMNVKTPHIIGSDESVTRLPQAFDLSSSSPAVFLVCSSGFFLSVLAEGTSYVNPGLMGRAQQNNERPSPSDEGGAREPTDKEVQGMKKQGWVCRFLGSK